MSKSIELIARGLLIRDGHFLACRNDASGYFYLPGGHVEFGESSSSALARELIEECGLDVEVGELRLVTEGAFTTRGKRHHEVNLVFHVKHPVSRAVKSREQGISFHWLDFAVLFEVDLRPTAIKAWLMNGGQPGRSLASEFPAQESGQADR